MLSLFASTFRFPFSFTKARCFVPGCVLAIATQVLPGCSVIIDGNVGAGIGAACEASADCQGAEAVCDATKTCTVPCTASEDCPEGATCAEAFCRQKGEGVLGDLCNGPADCESAICLDNLCSQKCSSTPDCPGGAVCIEGGCQLTLKSGFVFDNQVSAATEGFALSHEVGRNFAAEALPWLETIRSESNTSDTVSASIDGLIADGTDVVVVTTTRFATQASEKAQANPDVRFLNFAAASSGDNFTGYDVRYHQAWYLAGYVAGRFEEAGNIGFLGAIPNPQVIRQLNAFTLGVLRANPNARVEVVWANNFVPDNAVAKKLVDYLIEGGNRVIVNRLGKGTAVSYVQELASGGNDVFSMGLDNETACNLGPATCLGAPYYNWGPFYVRLLDSIHRNTFDPSKKIIEPILVDPAQSTFHFALNATIAGLDGLKPDIVSEIGDLVGENGEDRTFAGGFCVTDPAQRPGKPECSPKGEIVEDAELASMCFLVKGVVQPTDPEDPKSMLVPARAPDGTVLWPPKYADPTSITKPACK